MWNMNLIYHFVSLLYPLHTTPALIQGSLFAVLSAAPPIENFMTWDFLGTMSGAVAATTLIVQFLKIPLDKVWKIHTRYVVYFIAFFLLFFVEYFTGHITMERTILIMLNAIIVTMASMGTYEVTFKQVEEKK